MVNTVSYADIQKSSAFSQKCVNDSIKCMPNEIMFTRDILYLLARY